METQHVRYFLAIGDELNFTHAGQKCGIKQPSLSETIKRMEQAFGGDLLYAPHLSDWTALGSSYVQSASKSANSPKKHALFQSRSKT